MLFYKIYFINYISKIDLDMCDGWNKNGSHRLISLTTSSPVWNFEGRFRCGLVRRDMLQGVNFKTSKDKPPRDAHCFHNALRLWIKMWAPSCSFTLSSWTLKLKLKITTKLFLLWAVLVLVFYQSCRKITNIEVGTRSGPLLI